MEKQTIKSIFKNINIDTLLFDILLLITANFITFFIVNNGFLTFDENTDMDILSIVTYFLVFFLFVSIGELVGRYKFSKKRWIFFVVLLLLTFFSLLGTLDDIFNVDIYYYHIFIIATPASMSAGFLLGFLFRTKNFKKSIKITGIVVFVIITGVLILLVFIIGIEKLSVYDYIKGGVIFTLNIIFFLILPSKFADFVLKRKKIKKMLIYFFVIITSVVFALWDIFTENSFIVTDSFGNVRREDLFYLAYLPLISYRFLFALAPPKNKINMIIGVVVLLIVIIL